MGGSAARQAGRGSSHPRAGKRCIEDEGTSQKKAVIVDLALVTDAATEPITTAEAKSHVRQDGSDDDTYIDTCIKAARLWVERTRGLGLITQTWDGSLDAFPSGAIVIPKYPLVSISSVTYYDEDLSTSTVFSSTKYQVDAAKRPPRIYLKNGESWPTDSLRLSSGVVVRFVAGYGAASAVPADIKHAIKLLVGQMYVQREPEVTGTIVSRVGYAIDALLAPYALY